MTRLHRLALRAAFRGMQVWWFVARPHTQGVKLIVCSGGEILFVRHTYGNQATWEVPGGGRRRHEPPHQAAQREAREELGVAITDWAQFGTIVSREHATAELTCLVARHEDRDLHLRDAEIAEARWCLPSSPPQPLGRHAAEILGLPAFAKALQDA